MAKTRIQTTGYGAGRFPLIHCERRGKIKAKLKMVYWKGEKFRVGKLIGYPEVITPGETLEELEENIVDA